MMKKIVLILSLFVWTTQVLSQKTSTAYLPVSSAGMPGWMNLFYNGVTHLPTLERAYTQYYQTHPFEKNAYTQFYKRWMIENQRYAQDDGTLRRPGNKTTSMKKLPSSAGSKNPLSSWSLLGPTETFRPYWDDTLQPPVSWQVNLYAFDAAPSNHDILYACPETGGIFKTTDKGLNWFSVSDEYKLGTMTSIAVHPSNPDVVYAAGGNTYTSCF